MHKKFPCCKYQLAFTPIHHHSNLVSLPPTPLGGGLCEYHNTPAATIPCSTTMTSKLNGCNCVGSPSMNLSNPANAHSNCCHVITLPWFSRIRSAIVSRHCLPYRLWNHGRGATGSLGCQVTFSRIPECALEMREERGLEPAFADVGDLEVDFCAGEGDDGRDGEWDGGGRSLVRC